MLSLCPDVGMAQFSDHTHGGAGLGRRTRGRAAETQASGPRPGPAGASVGGLQHGLAQRKVPVVFGPVLFEMLPSHVLRRALFELHIPKAPVFGCALGKRQSL